MTPLGRRNTSRISPLNSSPKFSRLAVKGQNSCNKRRFCSLWQPVISLTSPNSTPSEAGQSEEPSIPTNNAKAAARIGTRAVTVSHLLKDIEDWSRAGVERLALPKTDGSFSREERRTHVTVVFRVKTFVLVTCGTVDTNVKRRAITPPPSTKIKTAHFLTTVLRASKIRLSKSKVIAWIQSAKYL